MGRSAERRICADDRERLATWAGAGAGKRGETCLLGRQTRTRSRAGHGREEWRCGTPQFVGEAGLLCVRASERSCALGMVMSVHCGEIDVADGALSLHVLLARIWRGTWR